MQKLHWLHQTACFIIGKNLDRHCRQDSKHAERAEEVGGRFIQFVVESLLHVLS